MNPGKRRFWWRRLARNVATMAMAVGVALPLAGCASPFALPTSGDVVGLPRDARSTQRVFTSPHGPEKGAQPDSIVRGFLAALPAGPQSDGFAVAREFLTSQAAQSWNPSQRVLVYNADPAVERKADIMVDSGSTEQTTVTVSLGVIGQLDAKGVYSASLMSSAQQIDYRLVQIDGQWRIYDLPSGIAILESDFQRVFKQVNLYQVSSDGLTFVPDVRWFGWRQWRTDAVRQLLADPPRWLSGAVRTMTDGSVSLADGSVSVVDSVPEVRLSSEVMRLNDADRSLLVRQIRLTLSDGDADAPLTVLETSGGDLSMADSAVTLKSEETPRGMYVLSSDVVIAVELPNLSRVGVLPDGSDVSDFVFAPWGGAVLRGNGTVECLAEDASSCGAILDGEQADVLAAGAEQEVWAAGDGSVTVWNHAGATATKLDASWLEGRQVLDMAMSPEGRRMVFAIRDSSGDELVMASVERDEKGRPVALSQSVLALAHGERYGRQITPEGHSMAFFDPTTMVVAMTDKSGSNVVRRMASSGPQQEQNVPDSPMALASGRIGASNGVFALDSLGVLRSMTGSLTTSWRLAASQVEFAYGR